MTEVIFISHPIRSDPDNNIRKILTIYEEILRQGNIPVAPHILAYFAFHSSLSADRAMVTKIVEEHLARGFVTRMQLYGDEISEGMFADMALADKYSVPFYSMTPATHRAFVEYEKRRMGLRK